ncbi:MAG: type II secretion system protein GspG [Holophagales bacterium]|jgi:hypothetical protein|nr:type II secretion system protein GspG [Holophagales bacterium]
MFKLSFLLLLCFVITGCSSNDPRLPERLYEDALALNRDGKTLEAKALMEIIVRRFPEKREGQLARQDVFMLEAILKNSSEDEKRQIKQTIKVTCEALKRYKDKYGEYPTSLNKLVPEYGLDQIPMTPWKHPLLYRPYVGAPNELFYDKKGGMSIRYNTKFDSYYLVSLGADLASGGKDRNADILVVDGKIISGKYLPPIPNPQPYR